MFAVNQKLRHNINMKTSDINAMYNFIQLGSFYTMFDENNPTVESVDGKHTGENKKIFLATEWDNREETWLYCEVYYDTFGDYTLDHWNIQFEETQLPDIRLSTEAEIELLLKSNSDK